MPTGETRTLVLDVAQELLQTRGLNAFSFRDLAEHVRIKSASIHYHFPTKLDLCRALIERHRQRVRDALVEIDLGFIDPAKKLVRYATVYQETLATGNRMCVCGMLAADYETLDPLLRFELRGTIEEQEDWLRSVLTHGRRIGSLRFKGRARDEARFILASLEGALLVARSFEDASRLEDASRRLLARLNP